MSLSTVRGIEIDKAVILDREPGDITTIEHEGSVDETRQAWLQMKAEIKSVQRISGV